MTTTNANTIKYKKNIVCAVLTGTNTWQRWRNTKVKQQQQNQKVQKVQIVCAALRGTTTSQHWPNTKVKWYKDTTNKKCKKYKKYK